MVTWFDLVMFGAPWVVVLMAYVMMRLNDRAVDRERAMEHRHPAE